MKRFLNILPALLLSAVMLGISVDFYMFAGLGSDSITVFEDGIHAVFGVSMGAASYIYTLACLAVAALIARKYIGWTSIMFSALCGPSIDLFSRLLSPYLANAEFMPLRVALLCCAILLTACSCAILIRCRSGMNLLDAIVNGVSDKLGVSYRVTRTAADALLFITGCLMGGTYGIGSIPAVLLTGTAIDLFVKLSDRFNP